MPIIIDGEEFFTLREATKLADRHQDTIKKWVHEGKIEGHKDLSSHWLVKTSSLNKYLKG